MDLESKEKLYHQLYIKITEEINNGTYKSGTKLPSVRTMTKELKIARNTVVKAYEELEKDGYIISQEKSGYYVTDPDKRHIEKNVTTKVKEEDSIPTVDSIIKESSEDFNSFSSIKFPEESASDEKNLLRDVPVPGLLDKEENLSLENIENSDILNEEENDPTSFLKNTLLFSEKHSLATEDVEENFDQVTEGKSAELQDSLLYTEKNPFKTENIEEDFSSEEGTDSPELENSLLFTEKKVFNTEEVNEGFEQASENPPENLEDSLLFTEKKTFSTEEVDENFDQVTEEESPELKDSLLYTEKNAFKTEAVEEDFSSEEGTDSPELEDSLLFTEKKAFNTEEVSEDFSDGERSSEENSELTKSLLFAENNHLSLETDGIPEEELPEIFRRGSIPHIPDLSPYQDLAISYQNIFSMGPESFLKTPEPFGESFFRTSVCKYLEKELKLKTEPRLIVTGSGIDVLLSNILSLSPVSKKNPALRNLGLLQLAKMTKDGFSLSDEIPLATLSKNTEFSIAAFLAASGIPSERLNDNDFETISTDLVITGSGDEEKKEGLQNWAREKSNRFIIEYNPERKTEVNTTEEADSSSVYLGSFSLIFGKGVQAAWMVLPEKLMKEYEKKYNKYNCTLSLMDQMALCDFLENFLS